MRFQNVRRYSLPSSAMGVFLMALVSFAIVPGELRAQDKEVSDESISRTWY